MGMIPDYRQQAIKIAKDFHYGKKIIKAIENAKDDMEISKIMSNARKQKLGED